MPEPTFEGPDKEKEVRLRKLITQVNRIADNLETLNRRTSVGLLLGGILNEAVSDEAEGGVQEKTKDFDQELEEMQEELSRAVKEIGVGFQVGDADGGMSVLFSGSGVYTRKDLYFIVQDQKKYIENINLLAEVAEMDEEAKQTLAKLLEEHTRSALRFIDDEDVLISQFASLKTIAESIPQELQPDRFTRIAHYAKRGIVKDGAAAMTLDNMFFIVGCGDVTVEHMRKKQEQLVEFVEELKEKGGESRILARELVEKFIKRINSNEDAWEEWGEESKPSKEFTEPLLKEIKVITKEMEDVLGDLG